MSRLIKLLYILGIVLLPILWLTIKYAFSISDRYLPSPVSVLDTFIINLSYFMYNAGISLLRLMSGYIIAVSIGVLIAIYLYRYKYIGQVIMPSLQALRAIPSTATVPFFLLWFGFSEVGKFLMIVVGISFNLTIASSQILINMPERYKIAFTSYGINRKQQSARILIPMIFTNILPTLRFSMAMATALVVVAEYLGAQSGLGYVLQGARTTYSMDTIIVCATLFGVIAYFVDGILVVVWHALIPWGNR